MKISNRGLDLIKEFEGFEVAAYKCPGDTWTIGHGHTKGVKKGDIITRIKAEEFLVMDAAEAEDTVNTAVKVNLNQNQFDSLVSFVFNIGSGNFETSTMLRKLNVRQYRSAAAEFDRWIYAGADKKALNGLKRRRKMEKNLFLSKRPLLKDQVILMIGDEFMTSRNWIEMEMSDTEYQMPILGKVLIFRDKGNRHRISNCRYFKLDQIK